MDTKLKENSLWRVTWTTKAYEADDIYCAALVYAPTEDIAGAWFIEHNKDAIIVGVKLTSESELMKPSIPTLTVPKNFQIPKTTKASN